MRQFVRFNPCSAGGEWSTAKSALFSSAVSGWYFRLTWWGRLWTQAEQARDLPNGLAALDQANHHCAAILAASRIRVNSY